MKDFRLAIVIAALFVALLMTGRGLAGDPPCCGDAQGDGFLQRTHPVGGWRPYGGGLLRWWHPECFPCARGPDDYCRKPLPKLCWPTYPSFYTWGPPQNCCSARCGFSSCGEPR